MIGLLVYMVCDDLLCMNISVGLWKHSFGCAMYLIFPLGLFEARLLSIGSSMYCQKSVIRDEKHIFKLKGIEICCIHVIYKIKMHEYINMAYLLPHFFPAQRVSCLRTIVGLQI